MKEHDGTLTMELTDEMAKTIIENFNLEIEVLQGNVTKLKDGRTRYEIEVTGEKAEMCFKFVTQLISKSNQINYN